MKFLKKVFLILALPVLVSNSYAMENGQNGQEKKIIVQCKDDQQFIIAYGNEGKKNDLVQALNKSVTIKHLTEDLPLKDGSTLIIAPVTKKRFEDHIWPYICEIDKNTANKNIEAKNLNLKTMCNLIKDANYLDIEPLLDICCKFLAAKKLCSDEGLAKFEKRKLIPSQCFPAEISKRIAKIMFEKYVKDNVKATINERLAKKLNHNGTVSAVCFSQDGELALTGSWDKTAKIWDTKTGECLRVFNHNNLVDAVCFSQDGTRALTGSCDRTAKIWNTKTGECLHTLNHNDWVIAVCFSQDGTRALTGSRDHTAKIWNLNWHKDLTCEQIQLLLLHYNKQPINSKHLNTIAATLPENLQEIIKPQSSGLKKYLIAGAAVTGIAGLYLLWNYLQK